MNDFSNVAISFDSLPLAENLEMKGLQVSYKWIKTVADSLFWILLIIVLFVIKYTKKTPSDVFDDNFYYILAGLIFGLLISVVMNILAFPWKAYAVREKDITYRSGLIFRKHVHVPFNRVQHVELSQGVLDRMYDLAKLKIFTAGGSRSDIRIPGLKNEEALRLKSFILQKTEEDES